MNALLPIPSGDEPPMAGSALSARNLGKRYGAVTALAGVSFDIAPGEIVALVGDNGAGKSTTVKLLSGAIAPTTGSVYVQGTPTSMRSSHDARESGIETVYQDLALAPNLSIAANIFLGREIRKTVLGGILGMLDYKAMDKRSAAELAGLSIRVPSVRTKCQDLSGGQRQAVAVARAATWGSKVVIMDEPTAALGVEEQHQVGELIREIARQGIGVLLVSHNIPQVHEIADRALVMFQGRLIANLHTRRSSVEDLVMWITGAAMTGNP
ncbi:ATP-binding cassette domain-containing protein [Paenarthrobacter sp. NPDC089322]|uniref:ATP-binding cassette domain-containing protein n=1 Tax=Paenarthrobacter sp. NPDC089322 TaxID=3155065 RepID=UPI0034497BE0